MTTTDEATPVTTPLISLTKLWQVTVAECGDLGGMIGCWKYHFTTTAVVDAWFKDMQKRNTGRDFSIYDEKFVDAIVTANGKSCYVVAGGPYPICPDK